MTNKKEWDKTIVELNGCRTSLKEHLGSIYVVNAVQRMTQALIKLDTLQREKRLKALEDFTIKQSCEIKDLTEKVSQLEKDLVDVTRKANQAYEDSSINRKIGFP